MNNNRDSEGQKRVGWRVRELENGERRVLVLEIS